MVGDAVIRSDLKPDPKPELRRRHFRDTWQALQAMKAPHQAALAKAAEAECAFLEMTTGGDEPEAWCESCGAPFFEHDDYVQDDDGIATCRYDAGGNRVGRCFAQMMGA